MMKKKPKKPKKPVVLAAVPSDYQALLDALGAAKAAEVSASADYLVAVGVKDEDQLNFDNALAALQAAINNSEDLNGPSADVLSTNSTLAASTAAETAAATALTAAKASLAAALQAVNNATIPSLPSVPE